MNRQRLSELLLVDDDRLRLVVFSEVLISRGFSVTAASSGYEAIELLQQRGFCGVVTDHEMGHCSGSEVARISKMMHPHMPVIMLSGHLSTPEDAVEFIDEFVSKGQSTEIALEVIERWTAKS